MSRPNKKSTKLESSASAIPVKRTTSMQNETRTKISSSASNVTRTTTRGTTKRKATMEALTKDERYLGGGSLIYTEEEGTSQDEQQERSTLQQGSTSKTMKLQRAEEVKGASKCFDDWKDFYLQIFGNLKSKSDLIIAFTHYIMTKNGFRCLGLGDDRNYAENETGSINLPEGWNQFPKYAIRYIYNSMLHILLAVHLEHRLVINLLNTRTNVVTNLTVFPEITARATCGGPIDKLIPQPEKLAQSLYSNMIQTFTDTKACALPPLLQPATSSEHRKTWNELELRQSIGQSEPIEEVVKEVERPSLQIQQDPLPHVAEMLDAQIQDEVEEDTVGTRRASNSSQKSSKRTSWADQQPQTANASNNNSNTKKRLKGLKTSLEEAVPSVKDAILCYVDAMVNNWIATYGKEIMKSGKMAIRNLAEQREIIEKYMHLAKPVTEPKGAFVIYNSRITLDDAKQRLLRENIENDLRKWKEETFHLNVNNEIFKPFTKITDESSKLVEQKKEANVELKTAEPARVSILSKRAKTKNQKNSKNMQIKILEGDTIREIVLKPAELEAQTKATRKMKTAKVPPTILAPPKIEPYSQKYKTKQLQDEIKSAYKDLGLQDATMNVANRKEGGSETKSKAKQQNTKSTENLKRKLNKTKSPTTIPRKSKSDTSSIKPSKSTSSRNPNKKVSAGHVRLSTGSPLKRLRFQLPSKFPPTPSYLSNKWPSTYKSLENLLKTSLPFSAQERKTGGYEQMNLPLEDFNANEDFSGTKLECKSDDMQTKADIAHMSENASVFSMQSIESHFAKQIEAKRLQLLEMVRRREQSRVEDTFSKKFLPPIIAKEKDVGRFVPPADDWSLWQFKLNLAALREKELLCASNKKITVKN